MLFLHLSIVELIHMELSGEWLLPSIKDCVIAQGPTTHAVASQDNIRPCKT